MHSDKVKWVREEGASGTFSVSIALYNTNYTINCIVITLKSGTPSTIKAGFTLGGDDLCWETDISFLAEDTPICLELQKPPVQDTIYFVIPSGSFDIDILFIQMIGA